MNQIELARLAKKIKAAEKRGIKRGIAAVKKRVAAVKVGTPRKSTAKKTAKKGAKKTAKKRAKKKSNAATGTGSVSIS